MVVFLEGNRTKHHPMGHQVCLGYFRAARSVPLPSREPSATKVGFQVTKDYDQHVDEVSVHILAGGQSTRMGSDKAFLELQGQTLLRRALKLARTVSEEVHIVGDRAKFAAFGAVVEDRYRERGPLGGIHAALRNSTHELNLILAVDLPFLEARFLRYLISRARLERTMVTVPRAGGGLQPLCAVYHKHFADVAEHALREGRNKIDPLFAEGETRVLSEQELLRDGFSPRMFRNINTPEEFESARIKTIEAE
jgi:molybdopterin-guanine dinucleotide biosynthesis protein A